MSYHDGRIAWNYYIELVQKNSITRRHFVSFVAKKIVIENYFSLNFF
jgi:hypothetical protein